MNTISALQIAKTLASEVHAGVLRPGDMFQSERELCERFGVGRNVVREAITMLQGMGVADLSKGHRPRVAEPTLARVMFSVSDAAQFFFQSSEGKAHLEQARLFLETSMIRHVVVHASHAQLAKMVSAVDECEAAIHDIAAFRDADAKFHRALAEVPGNPIFTALHDTFVERLMKNRPVQEDFEARNRASNDDHKQILAAVLAKKSDAAEAILTRHLTRNYGTYFFETVNGLGAVS
ncbi:FCD domain-containing protein [Devosia algicola]|uniref:FCD domain-containing protein n=1 Tax=Devosia algicola TaxID=3026418 RepID=A0ABY7YMY6_9HYPH|nr:FCD domain-containing protein [Devosia algicola]WDR02584.1 FCD domain-containing protein [Devosia algicola]